MTKSGGDHFARPTYPDTDPAVDALVRDVIGQVADKWTMLVLELLEEHGTLRFTQIGKLVGRISQKMLTKTLRQMECEGLVTRSVHPVIPPRVDYELIALGRSLVELVEALGRWAFLHLDEIDGARAS